MDWSRRLVVLVTSVICASASAGCAVGFRSVHAYLEPGVDLSHYHRYAWDSVDRAGTGDPRLDSNEIFQQRVQASIDQQLAARGFERVQSGASALLVHYHASVEQRIDLRDKETSAPCAECKPFIYNAGTLVIDLVEANSKRLLWRGWSERNLDGVIDDQRFLEARIDQSVARILQQLPSQPR